MKEGVIVPAAGPSVPIPAPRSAIIALDPRHRTAPRCHDRRIAGLSCHCPAGPPGGASVLSVAQWIVHMPPKRGILVRFQSEGPPRCPQAFPPAPKSTVSHSLRVFLSHAAFRAPFHPDALMVRNAGISCRQRSAYAERWCVECEHVRDDPGAQAPLDAINSAISMALSDTFVRQVKHAGKYWRMNYRYFGKQKTLALGAVLPCRCWPHASCATRRASSWPPTSTRQQKSPRGRQLRAELFRVFSGCHKVRRFRRTNDAANDERHHR
jgi:hypothetical protein